jgi:hypothetical protein
MQIVTGNSIAVCKARIFWNATWAVLLSCFLAVSLHAQSRSNPVAFAKRATWVGLFAATTIWPEEAFPNSDAALVIGVLGKNPFGGSLRTIEEKFHGPNNRKIVTKQCRTVEEGLGCHILYISFSEKSQWPQILNQFRHTTVLTVGETEEFAKCGGILSFKDDYDKLQVCANTNAQSRAGLRIDSQLLDSAIRVSD